MAIGFNVAGQNPSELADLVTKRADGQIEFTDVGRAKAEEIVRNQQIKSFSNRITHIIRTTPDDDAAQKELLKICTNLPGQPLPSQSDQPITETTTQGLATVAKARQRARMENPKNLDEALLNNVLSVCKKHYEQKELDDGTRRRISHVARIPIFALGAAFQLTKTLFKAIFLSVPIEIIDHVAQTNYGAVAGFSGVKEDLLTTVGLATKVLGCFNPKKGKTFFRSCKSIYNVLTWEKDTFLGLFGALPKPAGHQEPSLWERIGRRWNKTFLY